MLIPSVLFLFSIILYIILYFSSWGAQSWILMMTAVVDYVTNSVTYEIIITLTVLILSLLTSLGVLLATDTCFDFNLDGGYACHLSSTLL